MELRRKEKEVMRHEIAALSLMRRAEAARERKECLQSVSKDFDEGMFGQGKKDGGSRAHRDNRLECLERIKRSCDEVLPELEVDWDRFKAPRAKPRFYRVVCHNIGNLNHGNWEISFAQE